MDSGTITAIGSAVAAVVVALGGPKAWAWLRSILRDRAEVEAGRERDKREWTRSEWERQEKRHAREIERLTADLDTTRAHVNDVLTKYQALIADETRVRLENETLRSERDQLRKALEEAEEALAGKDSELAKEKQRIAELLASAMERQLADMERQLALADRNEK